MRLSHWTPLAIILCATPASAQSWEEFASRDDRFTINVAGQPQVREITWPTEYGMEMSGRVYSFARGAERYSLTAIDYRDAERKYYEKPREASFRQAEYWQIDILGSIQYAATKLFRQRPGARVTYDAWHYIDLVEGHQLHLTNADGTRTIAGVYLHENMLYILDATVPAKSPEPALFINSLGFLDADGGRVRYQDIYSNKLPPETRPARGGGRGGAGGGGGRGGAN
jgi:hypothetical protein